jgi:LacI family transcriptional regulator
VTRRASSPPPADTPPAGRVTLKQLAQHLGVSAATVSRVLNGSPLAEAIAPELKERVLAAARELRYRPHYMARSLRSRRSFSVGVLVPEISEPYAAEVISGIEAELLRQGYFYIVASHRRSTADRLPQHLASLESRRVEGFILVATPIEEAPHLPTVVVSGRTHLPGLTHVVIDHDRAAFLALSHLASLGHRRIAFFKGQPESSDTTDRWRAIESAAAKLGLEVRSELTVQLGAEGQEVFPASDCYMEGYSYGQRLLARTRDFTALFAFNDVSAIGAMRAFQDVGLRIGVDVSVVGFDDIQSAAFHDPSLTTVRQPLRSMGELAGGVLLRRLQDQQAETAAFLTMEPTLVVRGSTGPAPGHELPRALARPGAGDASALPH